MLDNDTRIFNNSNIKNSGLLNQTGLIKQSVLSKNNQGKVGEILLRTDNSATFIGFGLQSEESQGANNLTTNDLSTT